VWGVKKTLKFFCFIELSITVVSIDCAMEECGLDRFKEGVSNIVEL
jgi:hypothetical protein